MWPFWKETSLVRRSKKRVGGHCMTLYLKLLVVISIELRRLESEKISNWQIGSCVSSIILGQWGEGMGLLELYVPFLFFWGGGGRRVAL